MRRPASKSQSPAPRDTIARDRQVQRQLRRQSVALVVIVMAAMLLATGLNLLEGLELEATGVAFRMRGPQPPASPVVILAIDDQAFRISRLQWPWPRTYFAQMVDRLAAAGARTIAFDIYFHEPEEFGKPATYIVQGERLAEIAEQYGVGLAELAEANGIVNNRVCAGQVLTIPSQPPAQHTVVRDSIEGLAARYQIDPDALMRANELEHPCDLSPDHLLRIPVPGAVAYTVKEGDTLAGVAAAFQVNPGAIITSASPAQPAADPLVPGQTLTVQFGDAALAAAIRAAGNVILNGEIQERPDGEALLKPIPVLDGARAGFGLTQVRTEADGNVHRLQAWNYSEVSESIHYSWPIVTAALFSGYTLEPEPALDRFTFESQTIPLEASLLRINYRGPEGAFPTVSADRVVSGDEPAETFRDKIVLIGATTESLHDTYPTPFDQVNFTPGVEVMANGLDTVLSGQTVRRASRLVFTLSIVAAAGVALALVSRQRTTLAAGSLVILIVAYILAWLGAFIYLRVELPVVTPMLTLFAAFALPALERAVSEELEKRRVRGIFELFISPQMVGQLIEQGIDAMRGQRAELTILFSDIRGFTTMSEQMTPEELVDLLNEYLGAMTDVIHRNGGTVDKYEGDLVMAFFGAPLAYADHAERAVQTAIEMRQELDRLRTKWAAEGKPANLEMGIGLNTGEVFVGLVGSGRRVNYTVMGDAVNLASRLQDLTKDLMWPLLISEHTYAKIKDRYDAEFGESRLVKGKTVPVGIYKVLGQKDAPETARVRPLYA